MPACPSRAGLSDARRSGPRSQHPAGEVGSKSVHHAAARQGGTLPGHSPSLRRWAGPCRDPGAMQPCASGQRYMHRAPCPGTCGRQEGAGVQVHLAGRLCRTGRNLPECGCPLHSQAANLLEAGRGRLFGLLGLLAVVSPLLGLLLLGGLLLRSFRGIGRAAE